MKASVVIPTYNQVDLLRECLRSLESQTIGRDDFEVIVVNDGSEDDTSSFLEGYSPGMNLKVINHPRNLGRAAARNSGGKEASGELLICLDGDFTVEHSFIAEHLKGCGAEKECVCIGNVTLPPEEEVPFKMYLTTRGVHKLEAGEEVPFRYLASGNISLRRELFERVGGFDPQFSFYGGEDLDLAIRLQELGVEFNFLPAAISYHHLREDLESSVEKKYIFGNRALPLVIRKHRETAEELPVVRHAESLLFRFLVSDVLYRPLLSLAKALERFRFPDLFFDYLFHGATIRGMVDQEKTSPDRVLTEVTKSRIMLWLFVLWILFVNVYYYIDFALTRFEKLKLLLRSLLSVVE
jgi:GT2 family glycosyltransferase